MNKRQPHATIDVRDLIVPVTLLRVENILAGMAPGQIVEVLCADRETKTDLVDIMKNSRHRCQVIDETADHFRLLIEKAHD